MNATETLSVSRLASKTVFRALSRTVSTLFILAVVLTASSCKKRAPLDAMATGELKFQPTKFTDAIPDEYGSLIGVTQNPTDASWVGLWFQRSDKTVAAVFVNITQGRIYEKTLIIPRK